MPESPAQDKAIWVIEALKRIYEEHGASFAGEVAAHLLSATIGGALVAIVGLLISWIRNRAINRSIPVSGTYNTVFGDIVNGEKVDMKSVSIIKQKGRSIFGTTSTHEGREWILEGKILDFGHIYGTYKSADTSDQGIGSFYLRIKGRDLDGMWGGYDSENNRISSGRYSFKRVAFVKNVRFSEAYRSSIVDIAHREFGAGYFEKVFSETDTPPDHFLVALDGNQVRGFAVGRVLKKEGWANVLNHQVDALPRHIRYFGNNGRLGLLQSVAVDHRYQGRGIGRRLIADLQEHLRAAGADAILVLAWKNGSRVNAGPVLESLGYDSSQTIEGYWKEACDNKQFTCPDRTDQCVCSVKIFVNSNLQTQPPQP